MYCDVNLKLLPCKITQKVNKQKIWDSYWLFEWDERDNVSVMMRQKQKLCLPVGNEIKDRVTLTKY